MLSFVYRGNQLPIGMDLDLGKAGECLEEKEREHLFLVFRTAREMLDRDKGEVLPIWIFEEIRGLIEESEFRFAFGILKQIGVFKDDPFVIVEKLSIYLKPIDSRNIPADLFCLRL